MQHGCTTASIGCLDCKKPIIEAVQEEVIEIRERAKEYVQNKDLVRSIVLDGCEKAREHARQTLEDVRPAMGFDYR